MVDVPLPRLFAAMTAGRLTQWLVAPGQFVRAGDPLAEIRVDRTTVEVEAPVAGRIAALLVDPGAGDLPVGKALARIEVAATEPAAETRGAPDPAGPDDTAPAVQTFRAAVLGAISGTMAQDEAVIYLGDDTTGAQGPQAVGAALRDRFGARRVLTCAPTLQAIAGAGIGAALGGLRPVLALSDAGAASQAFDQIVTTAAKIATLSGGRLTCPIVMRIATGHVARGGAQKTLDLSARLASVAGLCVVAPATGDDAAGLMRTAMTQDGPVAFLEHAALQGRTAPRSDDLVPLGLARVRRRGDDVTLVAYGAGVALALATADRLCEGGHEAEVIDLRSLRPMDIETVIESLRKTGRCATIEETAPANGVGAHVVAQVVERAFASLSSPPMCLGGRDRNMSYAEGIEADTLPDVAAMADQIAALIGS